MVDLLADISTIGGGIREVLRQETANDSKFLGGETYYFELDVPKEVGVTTKGHTNFIFPLVLNPEEITMEEPFSVTATPTSQGGLWVEENGIIQRILRIKGHTGFEPRPYKGSSFLSLNTPRNSSYDRTNAKASPLTAISGHRHFQYLQDSVFRIYGDLKREPAFAADTKLKFHNPKDDEHWLVVPQKFVMTRNAKGRGRVLYEYDIELLVVDKATAADRDFSEDKGVLDTMKDGLAMAKSGIDLINGAVKDLTNLVNEIESLVSGFGNVFESVLAIGDSAAAFIDGTASLIASPFNEVTSLAASLDQTLAGIEDSATRFPDTIHNAVQKMKDGVNRLLVHPENFQTKTNDGLRAVRSNEELSTRNAAGLLAAAALQLPPNSFAKVLAQGTGLTAGDQLTAQSELGIGRALPEFLSAKEETLTRGDTLQNLASKHLGDARLWRHIAAVNNLVAPYISDNGEPGTLRKGQRILIPSFQPAPEQETIISVLGVSPEKPLRQRLLGTDWAFEQQPEPGQLFDIPIDVAGGSVDVKTVKGVPCLSQAMLVRTRTERGSDILYQTLGRRRVIATRIPSVDLDITLFRIAESIAADPRIQRVRQVSLNQSSQPDILDADITAEVRGFTSQTAFTVEGIG